MSDPKEKKKAMKMKKTLKTGIYSPLGAKKMSSKEKAEFKSKFVKANAGKQAMKAEKTVNSPKYKAVKTITKGLHKMPDGSVMKDSEMKKYMKTNKRLKKS